MAKIYKLIPVAGRVHVLCQTVVRGSYTVEGKDLGQIPTANYKGSMMALTGVLPKNGTLKSWLKANKKQ